MRFDFPELNNRAADRRWRLACIRSVICAVSATKLTLRARAHRFQDIRTFTQLSFSDVVEPAPPASAMPTYSEAIVNSYTTDYM